MPSKLMTPGVYIDEKNAFPSSAVAVETAVPVFIGYTETAEWNGKSLSKKPTKISSFAEYVERFGKHFHAKFSISVPDEKIKQETFTLNKEAKIVKIKDKNTTYMYNCIRLFYANGGGDCYILSVGTYKDKTEIEIKKEDYDDVFTILEKEFEPTLIVIPDAINLGVDCYNGIYTKVLDHCYKMQSRFGIFDVANHQPGETTETVISAFRNKIGTTNLKYGAAYYPWLKASIVNPSEVTFENLDETVVLADLLKEENVAEVIKKYNDNKAPSETDKLNYHQALKAISPTYSHILEEVRAKLNELPPSAAMAGLYTTVDNSRGVWKSPANVSVSSVNGPTVDVSSEGQEKLNVDAIAGLSVNVIRSFPGIGTLVWGGRTLDGNSLDWRYINVRRTMIMIEQSLKLATRAYVFEPNDANTWITVKSMMVNFLTNLWKQGALAGSAPEQAFDVQIGLGSTMTPTDILEGKMLITVKVAVVRPAEFIVITFQQQMQQS